MSTRRRYWQNWIGERSLARYGKVVRAAATHEPVMASLSDAELRVTGTNMPAGPERRAHALAAAREAARRETGQRVYDAQVLSALVLADGQIAEMATGEGKTLAIILAAYVHVTEGRSVHIALPNPYLRGRDHALASAILGRLGISVGQIAADQRPVARRRTYSQPVVYALFQDLALDYLRDSLASNLSDLVQGARDVVILDEVDSILIDNARLPVALSSFQRAPRARLRTIAARIGALDDAMIDIDTQTQSANLTDAGVDLMEAHLREDGLIAEEDGLFSEAAMPIAHRVFQALRARALFERDRDYLIRDGQIVPIDRLTGRPTPGRRIADGVHEALEAKEALEIGDEAVSLASMTLQNYMRLYDTLSGTTATARADEAEFRALFDLRVVPVPRASPNRATHHPDRVYATEPEKRAALVALVQSAHDAGRPVLVGTTSVEYSEVLSNALDVHDIAHDVLNARQTDEEARVISQAGMPGTVTIAANMAGRGTDIILGGPDAAKRDDAVAAGGLLVIGTDRHESRRLDDQLRGRTGRQGDPGESVFILSLDDHLLAGLRAKKPALFDKMVPEPARGPIRNRAVLRLFDKMQATVEGRHGAARKIMLKFDDIVHQQRALIFGQRREILTAADLDPIVDAMRDEVLHDLVSLHAADGTFSEQWDLAALETALLEGLGLTAQVQTWSVEDGVDHAALLQRLQDFAEAADREKRAAFGPDMAHNLQKQALIATMDACWSQHYATLEFLRSVVVFRAMGKHDPIAEFMTEAFERFDHMLRHLRHDVVKRWGEAKPFKPAQQAAVMRHILGPGGD